MLAGNLLTAANLKTYSGNFVVQSPIPLSVSRVRLTPSMNPNGNVDIEIRTNVDPSAATGTASWVVQFKGVVPMSEKTAKDFTFTSPATNIRQVEIRVNSSPSWVAFYEIEGF